MGAKASLVFLAVSFTVNFAVCLGGFAMNEVRYEVIGGFGMMMTMSSMGRG